MSNECRFCHKYVGGESTMCLSCKNKLLLIGISVTIFVLVLLSSRIMR